MFLGHAEPREEEEGEEEEEGKHYCKSVMICPAAASDKHDLKLSAATVTLGGKDAP